MSRSYKGIKLKKNRVYTGEELQKKFSISANTVSNWVKAGLLPSDKQRPYLFRGGRVNAFLKARRERAKTHVMAGEFRCASCQSAVFPEIKSIHLRRVKNGAEMCFAYCSECGGGVRKFISQADLDVFARLRDPNTPVTFLHEEMSKARGGIGGSEETDCCSWWCENDRILKSWQYHAGCLAEQTIDQHLAAIRFMEDVLRGKPFDQLTIQDVAEVRDVLKSTLVAKDEAQKSRSTVSHQASQIMGFLEWLIKQDGFKRLPRDLPGYMKMPKAVYAKALPKNEKSYPLIEEAEELLMGMPSLTVADKRARAMFAIAYMGALRADTITTLRVWHFDIENRQILQDARLSRTKNGKSLRIFWFPIQESFEVAVKEWLDIVVKAGLSGADALFPSLQVLNASKKIAAPDREVIEPMASKAAVAQAFAIACRDHKISYNPHSVKDTLAAERDRRPLTQQQRKAWSENMGHDCEKITETHYGKLTDDERFTLLEDIDHIGEENAGGPWAMSDEEKIAIMDSVLKSMKERKKIDILQVNFKLNLLKNLICGGALSDVSIRMVLERNRT